MHARRTNAFMTVLMLIALAGLEGCGGRAPRPGTVLDEAMRAKRTAATFPAADEDYFHDMDGGVQFTKEEIQGRNMWMVWTGGNDRLWDVLSRESFGSLDFLKTLSSHPDAAVFPRHTVELSRARERTVLHEGDRSGSEPLRACGSTCGIRSASPIRSRTTTNTRACRSARAERQFQSAPTTARRRESWACGSSPTRTSTRRRGRRGTPSATTAIPSYYERADLVKPYRVGDVVRVLPRGPEPGEAAGQSGEAGVGEPQLECRRAVLLVGPRVRLEGAPTTRRASSTRRSTRRCPERSTPRSSRRTTSTTRAR